MVKKLLLNLKQRKQLEVQSQTVNRLFYLGCGFTKFLTEMFLKLSFEEMLRARMVSSTWKRFIDEHVWWRHRSIIWILKEFPEIKVSSERDTLKFRRKYFL